jgi:hypothetical protein
MANHWINSLAGTPLTNSYITSIGQIIHEVSNRLLQFIDAEKDMTKKTMLINVHAKLYQ